MRDLLAALDDENRNIYQTRDTRLIPCHIIRFKSRGVRPSSSTSPVIASVFRGCWSNWSTARRSSRSTVSVVLRSFCYQVTFPSCSVLPDRLLVTRMCRFLGSAVRLATLKRLANISSLACLGDLACHGDLGDLGNVMICIVCAGSIRLAPSALPSNRAT